MVLHWLKQRHFLGKRSASAAAQPGPLKSEAQQSESLRYPPADIGLVIRRPQDILDANQDIVRRLQLHAATEAHAFSLRFSEPLERLAALINVLPATATGLFSGEMGLFRACIELGFYSFQASDGRIFTGQEGVERRHTLEARWRYLCFLAGLLFPIGKSLERAVVAGTAGQVWKRHFGGMTSWAEQTGTARIFVSWGSADSEAVDIGPTNTVSALITSIVGAQNLQYLEDGAADLVPALYQLSSGQTGNSPIAGQVLASCWEKVLRREAARRPQAFGRLTSGTHLGPYLVGAIRTQIEAGRWPVNGEHLKADVDGLYLAWPEASAALVKFGTDAGYPGWPSDVATLAELLKAADVVEGGAGDLGMIELVAADGSIQTALKFRNPLAVLADFDPSAFASATGKTLKAVLEADPLVAAENTSAEEIAQPASIPAAPIEELPEGEGGAAPAVEEMGQRVEPPAVAESSNGTEVAGPLREAAEVRYADLLPEDIRSSIASALHAELLGKIVKAWRDRGAASDVMRRVDTGAAIAFSFLVSHIRDVPTWVDAMSKAGLIYAPPATPGLRVLKIAIPEGKPAVQAVVLSNLACRRLGL
jgi:conjugal transfer pilus assembly protein TraI